MTDDGDWHSAVDLNLLSVVRLIRAALPHLEARKGNVITIESIAVKQPVAGLILSNSVRAAVIGLVKTLSDELGPKGVRLNNILPGMIMTDRSRSLAQTRASHEGKTPEQVISETSEAIPLRRYGDPDEIANLAVFLASGAASYITGTSILCDGGLYRGLY
jgi:3-oxoacyl-[acyl-carrier protein] reductase